MTDKTIIHEPHIQIFRMTCGRDCDKDTQRKITKMKDEEGWMDKIIKKT